MQCLLSGCFCPLCLYEWWPCTHVVTICFLNNSLVQWSPYFSSHDLLVIQYITKVSTVIYFHVIMLLKWRLPFALFSLAIENRSGNQQPGHHNYRGPGGGDGRQTRCRHGTWTSCPPRGVERREALTLMLVVTSPPKLVEVSVAHSHSRPPNISQPQ